MSKKEKDKPLTRDEVQQLRAMGGFDQVSRRTDNPDMFRAVLDQHNGTLTSQHTRRMKSQHQVRVQTLRARANTPG